MKTLREEFEKLPEIREIMNSHGIRFMNHSGFYEAYEFKDFEFEQYVNGAWYAYQEQHKKIVAYQKMIEVENCFDKANILSSGVVMHGEYYIDGYTLAAVNGAFHHGENVIHVGKADNPNQTLTINVDENGNIETSNHNGDGK